jgi:hypothetical protein
MQRKERHIGRIVVKVACFVALVAVTGGSVMIAARHVVTLVGVVAPSVSPALRQEAQRLASEYEDIRRYVLSKEAQASSELACLRAALRCVAGQQWHALENRGN